MGPIVLQAIIHSGLNTLRAFGCVHSETNTLRARTARFARALRPSAFGLRLVAGGLRAYTAPVPLDLFYPCTRREVSTEGSMALEDL